jgi:hypothetical protein
MHIHRGVWKLAALLSLALGSFVAAGAPADAPLGKRPYELDWANRSQDDHPPLVDFEDLTGWRVECKNAEARWECSREQQIWGSHVGKLTYRGTNTDAQVRLLPPQPLPIREPFDAVTLWCYGNNWGYAPDPNTPQVGLSALFEDATGRELSVYLYHVDWTEWYLVHRRLSPDQIERVKKGAKFKGLLIAGARNKQDRVLYFDNLAVFTEAFAPLQFAPRPERGIAMFPGQSAGLNNGPDKLPFPNRPETILPPNLSSDFKTSLVEESGAFVLTYTGTDSVIAYRYEPRSGTWSDLEGRWTSPSGTVASFRPCVGGGVYLQTSKGAVAPESATHLGTQRQGDTVESRWRLRAGDVTAEVTYRFRLWNKSLVIDVLAPGGQVAEVRLGRAMGLQNPRLVTNPFYPADGGRPAVAVSGSPETPLFLSGNVDWYLSNGSILWAANSVTTNGTTYNGGTRYVPLTNGKRNDCFERFFLTFSPRYEEVLPVVPNPVSPWKHIAGTRLWRAHGASDRKGDARFWTEAHRYGLTQVIVTDHETLWRDGGESFTFRTKAAPGKGGDQGAFDYARLMQDQLGFVYGPYNNFTDFAPVNEFWSTDLIARSPDNQLQRAWMRCYAPKPARAVEYCARLAPEIQRKFRFSTAYCDVHTAVAPWHRVDYDPRVPGAGTFAAVFYSYGEIMLLQKQAWNGPVYSEGNYHAFYCGLTDGNYGQDQSYRPAENPWLVDFDLRRLHDLCCNFGMGAPDMFYANATQPHATPEQRDAWLDRFLAATVAFGHPGFLVFDGGMGNAMRSYYMLQQLHSRYCLTNAADIRYANADGALLDTSRAVASGVHARSQVVTRYADGTVTAANGSRTERLRATASGHALDLPPNGYAGWTADGSIEVSSGDRDGHRCDYASTPAYLYVDGRGHFARFAKAAGDGIGVCRVLGGGSNEVILYKTAECGFDVRATSAVALDKEGKDLGPAQLRRARGLTYVVPVKAAFSYLLRSEAARNDAAQAGGPALSCDRDEVVPGERVVVRGAQNHEAQIPTDAKPGQRLWLEFEGAWIDFTVVQLAEAKFALEDNLLRVELTSHLPRVELFEINLLSPELRGQAAVAAPSKASLSLTPAKPAAVTFNLGAAAEEAADLLAVELRAGDLAQRVESGLRSSRGFAAVASLPGFQTRGICLRGGKELPDLGQSGACADWRASRCGDVEKHSFFMHPPYQGGVGYTYALYEPLTLPASQPAAFRAWVGKADGSDPGDGHVFKLAVVEAAGAETVVAQTNITQHEWRRFEADLSRWAGQTVRLKLIVDVGPRNDSSGDWAPWAEMRLETLRPVVVRSLDAAVEKFRREPAPYPLADLTPASLTQAKRGWLRYDGKGLEGHGKYGTIGVLNGVDLGEMTPSFGDELHGKFAERTGLPLTADAIRALRTCNRFVLKNPNHDSFSIRRFWIELELADGRRCSSEITPITFSQPPEWPHAEGERVPFGQNIEVDICFQTAR